MKKFLKNKVLWLIMSLALITSCNTATKTGNKVVLIGSFSKAVDYAPYLVAKSKHWFEDSLKAKGTKVEYKEFQTLPSINEAFATKKIDIVFEAAPPAIIGRASGINIEIKDISCNLVQEILVPVKSNIQTIADLKGKTIAVLAGTSSHYGVLKLLKDNNINPKDVQIINMTPTDAKAAFESGQINAWAVWPPFVEQEEIAGTGRTLPKGNAYINSIMAVRTDFIKKESSVFNTIDNVFNYAKKWIIENPDSAIMIVSKQLNVPVAVIQKAWPNLNWNARLNEKVIDDIQAKADFLKKIGKIQNSIIVKNGLIPIVSKK